MSNTYVTTKEAAGILKLEESRVRQLAIKGTIKGIKRPDHEQRGMWYLEVKSVYEYGAARRTKTDRRGLNGSKKSKDKK